MMTSNRLGGVVVAAADDRW